ncbi:MAG TPA: hypothetical protein VGL83_15385 [Stellaceae bacterium]|jgi:hypothetical protein
MAVDIIRLKAGQRRPHGDKSPLIICSPQRRQEENIQATSGMTMKIRTNALPKLLKSLESKGVARVYVRGG